MRAPRLPGPDQHARAWDTPEELAAPGISRALKRIYHFRDFAQDLQLSCYKCEWGGVRKSPSLIDRPLDFEIARPQLIIDWKNVESANIRLPANGVSGREQDKGVDDLRSFLGATYQSVIVTAMEMARLIYGGPYKGSYMYSRESVVNMVRGARWDVLPYAKDAVGSDGPPEKPKMVVICVPPWDLSRVDLQDFAARRTVSIDQQPGHASLTTMLPARCRRTRPYSR